MTVANASVDAVARTDPSARLFLALWPGPRTRAALQARRDAWNWGTAAMPMRPEQLHLTLHYIGAVPRARLAELVPGLRVPCHRHSLAFGSDVLWPHGIAVLEPTTQPAALLQLHAALGAALLRLGLSLEARPFRPHVTLARHAQGSLSPSPPAALQWPVRGYALVESQRHAPGSAYRVLQRYTTPPAVVAPAPA